MIDLADIKAHLNVTTDVDDALITEKLSAASDWVAKFTGIPADASDIPAPVNEGVRLLTAHLYANREASLIGITAQSLPFGLLDMLSPYREWVF